MILQSLCYDVADFIYKFAYDDDLSNPYEFNLFMAKFEVLEMGLFDEFVSLGRKERERVLEFALLVKEIPKCKA